MGMIDMSGQPRTDEDLQDAIDCINTVMVKHPSVLPLLTVHAGIIRGCLLELQERRKKDEIPVNKEGDA